jgi:YidC/Oxa1 family membrane protein insertase
MKQQRSTKAMQELQPELKKIQEKYKNDRERAAQAQWELYREYGVNPLAGCLPLLIQFPILIGLYRAIVTTLAATPLQLLNLSGRVWVPELSNQVPLENRFLWLNLAVPDPLYILPILVVITTWLQQKLLMPSTSTDSGSRGRGGGDQAADQAAQISRQMMMIMPIMFGFFALSFASGLSIYFIGSNLIGIGQYAMMGRIDFKQVLGLKKEEEQPAETGKPQKPKREEPPATTEEKPKRTAAPSPKSTQPLKIKRSKRSGIYDSRAERARAKR